MKGNILLEVKKVSKRFGGVQALQSVDFAVFDNEIVALVGENGAGKSTLIKIISGVNSPDEGEIYFMGRKVVAESPRDIRRLGIETVYQDLSLADNVDVATNIFIGRELIKNFVMLDKKRMEEEALKVLGGLKTSIKSAKLLVKGLSGGQRQAVAVGRATYWNARIIIMDEPTAALGVEETNKVLDLIKRLKMNGITVILISHNLQHVFSVADRIVILRGGKNAGERITSETTRDEIISLIVG